jgi:hypothetical protein
MDTVEKEEKKISLFTENARDGNTYVIDVLRLDVRRSSWKSSIAAANKGSVRNEPLKRSWNDT